jgi:NAD+ synthase (glutamine-hydrolysing)
MQIILHQTHHKLADLDQIFNDLLIDMKAACQNDSKADKDKSELHIYPESYLTGYPLQDIVLHQEFIQNYQSSLVNFSKKIKKMSPREDITFLVGGISYELTESGDIISIKNYIYQITPGQEIKPLYAKRLLPNYDVFDEKKYYTAGTEVGTLQFADKNIALLICEDMWPGYTHKNDPSQDLYEYAKKHNKPFDLIVNLSASPFFKTKQQSRLKRGKEISMLLGAPLAYVNRVGAEDEILFDGGSFIVSQNEVIKTAPRFCAGKVEMNLCEVTQGKMSDNNNDLNVSTWEELYEADLDDRNMTSMPTLTDLECQEILAGLCFGLNEYMTKTGFETIDIALSGGIDSGVVLAIAALTLQDNSKIEAIYMPSQFSQSLSRELSEEICSNLGIRLRHFPIKFLHSATKTQYNQHLGSEIDGLTDENLQSRLRGLLIYARSNQTGSLVLNTSNKSELAVGYSTLYGDSVGAISILGDLYKSQVFRLAEYINTKYDNIIPKALIEREPTAELRDDQTDSQSLPPYDRLDAILEGILSYSKSPNDLLKAGFDQEEITKVLSLYKKSEYKRKQFCPIIKVEAKSFGYGYRMPITKKITKF